MEKLRVTATHTLLAFSDTAAGTQESVDCQIFFIYPMEIHGIYRGYAHDSGGWGHQRRIGKNNGGNQQFPPMAPISYVTMMSEQSAGDLTSIWL
jgi:hypothetical protein